METYNKIIALVEAAKEDVEKFYAKGNSSAGPRIRKHMQDLKNLAQELRLDVQNVKNGGQPE
jgi:hypothetical protein